MWRVTPDRSCPHTVLGPGQLKRDSSSVACPAPAPGWGCGPGGAGAGCVSTPSSPAGLSDAPVVAPAEARTGEADGLPWGPAFQVHGFAWTAGPLSASSLAEAPLRSWRWASGSAVRPTRCAGSPRCPWRGTPLHGWLDGGLLLAVGTWSGPRRLPGPPAPSAVAEAQGPPPLLRSSPHPGGESRAFARLMLGGRTGLQRVLRLESELSLGPCPACAARGGWQVSSVTLAGLLWPGLHSLAGRLALLHPWFSVPWSTGFALRKSPSCGPSAP